MIQFKIIQNHMKKQKYVKLHILSDIDNLIKNKYKNVNSFIMIFVMENILKNVNGQKDQHKNNQYKYLINNRVN